jgi:hypothetical protein
MKTLSPSSLALGGPLAIGLVATVIFFLWGLLFTGSWVPFFWSAGLSLALVVAIKLLALRVLDDERQLLVSGMLWELLGGVFGWTWIALAVASVILIFKTMFFGGAWSDFFVCLFASAACKRLTRFAMTTQAAATFKQELVTKGMTKEAARQVWIARARAIIQGRNQANSELEAAQSLTTAYSKLLQTPRDHFWPLSALPADKKTMKAALKMDAAFQISQGELDKPLGGREVTLRDIYISTYARLADFVPDDLATRVNFYWKSMRTELERVNSGQIDEMTLAQILTKLAPSQDDEREIQKARAEWPVLADEMRAHLDRIAPLKKP